MDNVRFRRVDEYDPSAVNLQVWEKDGQPWGILTMPAVLRESGGSIGYTKEPLPIAEAIRLATGTAEKLETDIAVELVGDVWRGEWGDLR